MLYELIGRSLQAGGIVLCGLALVTGIRDRDMGAEMALLGLAIVVFVAGWKLLEVGE